MAVIISMSLVLGAELGSKANPTTTTYVPRPEWYFFFLFEVLRVIKPPGLLPLATIGVHARDTASVPGAAAHAGWATDRQRLAVPAPVVRRRAGPPAGAPAGRDTG